MEIKRVGSRGTLFTRGGISVYVLHAEKKVYLCDTHCGSSPMEAVKEFLDRAELRGKELIIFNSHSDWDHVWGNGSFPEAQVIGHARCKARMEERGQWDIDTKRALHQGHVELRPPELTFEDRLWFPEDQVEFIYTPGHTECSSICLDHTDGVQYVGDMVEAPIPFLLYQDLERYAQSLRLILSLPASTIVTGHSGVVGGELVERSLGYVRAMALGQAESSDSQNGLHQFNVNNLVILKYESMLRKMLGREFSYPSFMRNLWGHFAVPEDQLGRTFSYQVKVPTKELEDVLEKMFNATAQEMSRGDGAVATLTDPANA